MHLPHRQMHALRAALGEVDTDQYDPIAIYSGLFAFIAESACQQPLVIATDDAHWLDAETLDALGFVARRIQNEPVGLLFAARDLKHFRISGVPEMAVDGLDAVSGVTLVRRGAPDLALGVARTLVEWTNGNPLALLELPNALRPEQRSGRVPLDDPVTVTAEIERAFLSRARHLSPEARDVLLLAAVGDPGDLDVVLQSGIRAGRGLHEAECAGLLEVRRHRLEFRHPLVRSAIYSAATENERRVAHGTLAVALARVDRFRAAWHQAHAFSGHDQAVAETIARSGDAAMRGGAASTAARLFECAAAKSPDAGSRARWLLRAGEAAWLAGRSSQAQLLLHQAREFTSDPVLTADLEIVRWWAVCSGSDPGHLFEPLIAQAKQTAKTDVRRAAKMLAIASDYAFDVMDIGRSRELAVEARDLLGDRSDDCEVLTALAWAWIADGEVDAALDAARRTLALLGNGADIQLAYACDVLTTADLHDEAERNISPVIRRSRSAGHIPALAYSLASLALIELRRGRLARSLSTAMQALAVVDARPPWIPLLSAQAAECEAALGMAESCRRHAAAACDSAWNGTGYSAARAQAAVGLLELGLGDVLPALHALERAHTIAAPIRHPGFIRYAGDLVEALARAGDVRRAEAVLADLERRSEECGSTWARHVSLRCRLLLAPAADVDRRWEQLRDAPESPFEEARTSLIYGERLRRAGLRGEARAPLRVALCAFESLGAGSWAERTRAELRATGLRLGRPDVAVHGRLTPQELRVALVVAEGVTNREAAARLFLSEKTVEFHLSSAFRKLNVRTRTELARKLALTNP